MAAYNAPGYTCNGVRLDPAAGALSPSSVPAPNRARSSLSRPPSNPAANLGTKSFTATASGSGVATFMLTLAPAGAYTLTLKGASGQLTLGLRRNQAECPLHRRRR